MQDLLRLTPVDRFLERMAASIIGPKAEGMKARINLVLTDLGESYLLELDNGVLHHRKAPPDAGADTTLTVSHAFFLRMMSGKVGAVDLATSSEAQVSGSALVLGGFLLLLEKAPGNFPIVTRPMRVQWAAPDGNGEVMAMSGADVAGDTDAMLGAALERQRAAYLAHPVPTLAERRSDLAQLARFVRENRQALIEAVSADYGHRSSHETLITEIGPLLAGIRFAQRHLRRWMRAAAACGPAVLRAGQQFRHSAAARRGRRDCARNFPINLSLVPLTYILAAGNRALVKMSENSRHLARLLIERIPAYFPPEKLRFFDETGGVGVAFSKLPFDHLLFTGSSATGRAAMAAAAQNLCPVTLELGGRAPAIVCDDFDLELAAKRILFVKYLNAGQVCTTVNHVYVPEGRVADFVAIARRIVPTRYAGIYLPDLTSIIDRRAYERLRDGLAEAEAGGAEVIALTPGKAFDEAAHRIAPHIVINAPETCALMQREIFGPILPVIGYRDLDAVIAAINAGPRPLALYPFSNRREMIDRLVERTMSGGITVNDALMHVGQGRSALRRRWRSLRHGPLSRPRGLQYLLQAAAGVSSVALERRGAADATIWAIGGPHSRLPGALTALVIRFTGKTRSDGAVNPR